METVYKFKMTGKYKPISWTIPNGVTGKLTVNTKKKNKEGKEEEGKYAIRYCHNENSIFITEQSEFADVTEKSAINFKDGYFHVKEDNKPLLSFLKIHPLNGKKFVEINEAKEAKESLKRDDLVSEIKYQLMQMAKPSQKGDGKHNLEAIAATLLMSLVRVEGKSVDELRQIIHPYVEGNPYQFIDNSTGEIQLITDETHRKYFALKAIKKGILDISRDQKRIVWGKNKEVALNIPVGRKPVEYLADHLLSEDGTLMFDEIQKSLRG